MIPLVLVVGALGAGKTTLLRRCLPDLAARGLTPSVILNDYVDARVDAATLAALVDDLTPIGGTCVCCESSGELIRALAGARRGPRPIALVEANGTVDAAELIEILVADGRLAGYTLPVQVSVVDATRWQRRGWLDGLEAEQARSAAFAVIARAQDVGERRRTEVAADLGRLAPGAAIRDEAGLVGELDAIQRSAGDGRRRFDTPRVHHSGHDPTRHHFSAAEIPLPRRVDRGRLERWLRDLPGAGVRVKGVAYCEDEGWFYFSRIDDPASVRLQPVPAMGLDPVAILIGAALPADAGEGIAAISSSTG